MQPSLPAAQAEELQLLDVILLGKPEVAIPSSSASTEPSPADKSNTDGNNVANVDGQAPPKPKSKKSKSKSKQAPPPTISDDSPRPSTSPDNCPAGPAATDTGNASPQTSCPPELTPGKDAFQGANGGQNPAEPEASGGGAVPPPSPTPSPQKQATFMGLGIRFNALWGNNASDQSALPSPLLTNIYGFDKDPAIQALSDSIAQNHQEKQQKIAAEAQVEGKADAEHMALMCTEVVALLQLLRSEGCLSFSLWNVLRMQLDTWVNGGAERDGKR